MCVSERDVNGLGDVDSAHSVRWLEVAAAEQSLAGHPELDKGWRILEKENNLYLSAIRVVLYVSLKFNIF